MKYLIDFKNDKTSEQISTYISSLGGTVLKTYSLYNNTYLVDLPSVITKDDAWHDDVIDDDQTPIDLLSTMIISDQTFGKRDPLNEEIVISTSLAKDWWKNYVISSAELDSATYAIDRRGSGQVVYLLDSGIDSSHIDFQNRTIQNLFSFNNDFTDTNGHGTALASVISGNTCGLTNATLKAVKIFDNRQSTKQSDLVNALDAIYTDFITSGLDFAVVNCSWIISKNSYIENKLQNLINIGLFVVAAAGNNGAPISDHTPASMSSALTVGSFNSNLEPCDFSNYTSSSLSITESYTNYGELDGWAPGEDIYVALQNNQFGNIAGTSVSAAIHSAVIVYNISLLSTSERFNVPIFDYVSGNSFDRRGLLNLSDPKYVENKNLISTCFNIIDFPVSTTPKIGMSTMGRVDDFYSIRIFFPNQVKSLEILGDLPPNTYVNNKGIFFGPTKNVTEVLQEYIPMKVTDLNDQVIEFDFEILSIPKTFVVGVDSTGDQVLDLKLQATRDCRSSGCEPADGCNETCYLQAANRYCANQMDKSCAFGTYCQCVS
jgi:subtilisin family serine protease